MTRWQGGYIFKRGKHPVWVARWRESVIEHGRETIKHRARVLGRVSEMSLKQARLELEKLVKPLNEGTYSPRASVTFGEFAAVWKELVFPNFKPSTRHGYETVLRAHVLPAFAHQRLSELRKEDVQRLVMAKLSCGLRWQTVRNCWIVLSSVLDSACEYGYLAANPARGVKFPTQSPKPEPKILSAADFQKLLRELEEPYRTMAQLSALTGLRIGELCALRRDGVDLEAGVLHVRQAVFQGQFSQPKGNKLRTIPISALARRLLRERLSAMPNADATSLIFARGGGRPYRADAIGYKVIAPAARRAGLGKVTCHQLRHIHSSILHDLGVPVAVIQKQLGHSRAETTLNIYTHAIDETHRRAVELLDEALFPNCAQVGSGDRSGQFVN